MVFKQTDLRHPFRALSRFVTSITSICTLRNGVKPRSGGLNAHLPIHELVANYLMIYQCGAKSFTLVCPTQCLGIAALREAQGHGSHGEAFAIEIGKDDLKARALFPTRLLAGTRTPLKLICVVSEHSQPIFFKG